MPIRQHERIGCLKIDLCLIVRNVFNLLEYSLSNCVFFHHLLKTAPIGFTVFWLARNNQPIIATLPHDLPKGGEKKFYPLIGRYVPIEEKDPVVLSNS